jgi:hypothetical protein
MHPRSLLHHDLYGLLAGLASGELLVDEQGEQTDSNNKDDTEHNDNTGLLASPVRALGDGAEGVASDNGSVDGRHFKVWNKI